MRLTTALASAVGVGVLLTAPSSANAAAYTFTQIDVPGASFTQASGINDAGQIVGSFFDTAQHGFIDSGGIFTTLDVPGANHTIASGINNAGQIGGFFNDSANDIHGFLYAGGTFTQIDVPGASFTQAKGINDAGQIVGSFVDSTGSHGFLDTDDNLTALDVPLGGRTDASGINDAGQIVGSFFTGGPPPDFHGFLYADGSFTIIDVPPTPDGTQANGINDAGQIVGSFPSFPSGGHGFLAIPVAAVPEPSSLVLLGIGVVGLGILRGRKRTSPALIKILCFCTLGARLSKSHNPHSGKRLEDFAKYPSGFSEDKHGVGARLVLLTGSAWRFEILRRPRGCLEREAPKSKL